MTTNVEKAEREYNTLYIKYSAMREELVAAKHALDSVLEEERLKEAKEAQTNKGAQSAEIAVETQSAKPVMEDTDDDNDDD